MSAGDLSRTSGDPTLNDLLTAAGLHPLESEVIAKFNRYLSLILRWNARTNLTAVRAPEEILRHHFIESIACAQALPNGIASLLDFGSGAGFPGIPIALCRPEITVTLAESQNKKAAFLQEAVRTLQLNLHVFAGRAGDLTLQFDCVTMRAVDRMDEAVDTAAHLVRPGGWLAIMSTRADLPRVKSAPQSEFHWSEPIRLPGSEQRVLGLGLRGNAL